MKRFLKSKVLIALALFLFLYVGTDFLVARSYWAALFLGTYVEPLPKPRVAERWDGYWRFRAIQRYLDERISTPATARHCSFWDLEFGYSEGFPAVKGWLDAQNSFGALVRIRYIATFNEGITDTVRSFRDLSQTQ